jgi:plastocyanin
MRSSRRAVAGLALVCMVVLLLSGCSKSNKVGNNSLLNVKNQVQGQRLGETTTTQAPTATSTHVALGVGQATSTTARAAQTATTQAQVQATVITINGDNSTSPQFDPPTAAVYVGGLVKWVNADKATRSVVAANGAFKSPDLASGASWTYQATTAGTFDYQDGTRPYANGQLQVVAR